MWRDSKIPETELVEGVIRSLPPSGHPVWYMGKEYYEVQRQSGRLLAPRLHHYHYFSFEHDKPMYESELSGYNTLIVDYKWLYVSADTLCMDSMVRAHGFRPSERVGDCVIYRR